MDPLRKANGVKNSAEAFFSFKSALEAKILSGDVNMTKIWLSSNVNMTRIELSRDVNMTIIGIAEEVNMTTVQ